MNQNTQATTSRLYRVISAALAFLLWGGWSFIVNGEDGLATRMVSSITQGTASFVITLVMVRIITWLYRRLPDVWFRVLLPAVITVTCTGSIVVLVHVLVGTPQITMTVIPAFTVAFGFSLFTAYKLKRSEQEQTTP